MLEAVRHEDEDALEIVAQRVEVRLEDLQFGRREHIAVLDREPALGVLADEADHRFAAFRRLEIGAWHDIDGKDSLA